MEEIHKAQDGERLKDIDSVLLYTYSANQRAITFFGFKLVI